MYVRVCICVRVYMCAHIYICMYIYACMRIHMFFSVYVYVYTYMYTHTHIRIYIYIYTRLSGFSHNTNTFEEGMKSIIFPPAIGIFLLLFLKIFFGTWSHRIWIIFIQIYRWHLNRYFYFRSEWTWEYWKWRIILLSARLHYWSFTIKCCLVL